LPAACFNQYNAAVSSPDNQLNAVQRKLELCDAELKEAHRHIVVLEEKLLKVKEYQRELKGLKEERRRLRESAERRVGQVLLAPYRVSEKLAKTVWRKFKCDARIT
jgi:chromosome segregation ATPase